MNQNFKPGYYYLQINSQILWKPENTDEQYFNNPLIVEHWKVENQFDFQRMITQAKQIDSGVRNE